MAETIKVEFGTLEEAVENLNNNAKKLYDPIENYLKQSGKMGEDGAIAWGGDAAERAMPVINSIKNDIVQLQNACQEFSENIHLTQSNFTKADATAENSISDLNNI